MPVAGQAENGEESCGLRYYLDRRTGESRTARVHEIVTRPLPTVLIGVFGGIIVGMTSVGSGSLMIVLLLFLYPMIGANQLVGTDLTQAVPLTAAAALGALAFGHVEFGVTLSLIIGSVPAVLVGSLISSSVPDRYIRPVITFVVFASGLKYVGVGTEALGWILCAVLLAAAIAWLITAKPWLKPNPETQPPTIEPRPTENPQRHSPKPHIPTMSLFGGTTHTNPLCLLRSVVRLEAQADPCG